MNGVLSKMNTNNVIDMNRYQSQTKVLITHTDLDGIGCAYVFLKCYPEGRVFFADYDDVNEIVVDLLKHDDESDILISDISVNKEVAELLNRRGKVGLLDHHDTAKWLRKYSWATIDTSKCGTRLVYELLQAYFHIQDLEPFVATVEDWDLWGAATGKDAPGEKAIETQLLLEFYGRRRFLSYMLGGRSFDHDVVTILFEKLQEYCEETADLMELYTKDGYKVGVCVAEQHKSLLGHYLLNQFDLEYVMMLDPRHNSVSLRGKGNIHLGKLAKKAGGGGHPKAAGFPIHGLQSIWGGVTSERVD